MNSNIFLDIQKLYNEMRTVYYDPSFTYVFENNQCIISLTEIGMNGSVNIKKTFSNPLKGNEIDYLKRLKKYLELCRSNNFINNKKFFVSIKDFKYPTIIDENNNKVTYDDLYKINEDNIENYKDKLLNSIRNVIQLSSTIPNNIHRLTEYESNYEELTKIVNEKKNESSTLFGKINLYLKKIVNFPNFTFPPTCEKETIDCNNLRFSSDELEKIKNLIIFDHKSLNFNINVFKSSAEELSNYYEFFSKLERFLIDYNEKIINRTKNVSKLYIDLETKLKSLKEAKSVSEAGNILNEINPAELEKSDIIEDKITFNKPIPSFIPSKKDKEISQEVLVDIQKDQSKILSDREKTAIMLYKTQLYRAINPVQKYLRSNNLKIEDIKDTTIFDELISKAFDEYMTQRIDSYISEQRSSSFNFQNKSMASRIDNKFKPYRYGEDNKEELYIEYKGMVIEALEELESALSKCRSTEDLILYRGIGNSKFILDEPFLSTSTDPSVALDFAKLRSNEINNDNNTYVMASIKVPKGSPLVFITHEIWDGIEDEKFPFPDAQKEVILDTSKYTYEFVDSYEETNTYFNGKKYTIVYLEYKLKEKKLEDNKIETLSENNDELKR